MHQFEAKHDLKDGMGAMLVPAFLIHRLKDACAKEKIVLQAGLAAGRKLNPDIFGLYICWSCAKCESCVELGGDHHLAHG